MLSKRSQTQVVILFLIPFQLNSRKGKTIVTVNESRRAQASTLEIDYIAAQRSLWSDRNALNHFGS